LSNKARQVIENDDVQKFISAVSAYEIMYKHRLGKLHGFEDVVGNYFNILRAFRATELPIYTTHAHLAGEMDWEHRDPFDRIFAAQASIENMTLLTNDHIYEKLSWVSLLW
jgi:PIN domain nuclease of toxin-antitoxin system